MPRLMVSGIDRVSIVRLSLLSVMVTQEVVLSPNAVLLSLSMVIIVRLTALVMALNVNHLHNLGLDFLQELFFHAFIVHD